MDVKLSADQIDLQQHVRSALQRYRSNVPLLEPSAIDVGALAVLDAMELLDILEAGGTAVDATIVIDMAAAETPGCPVSARALVGPLITDLKLPNVVALVDKPSGGLVRFADQAEAFLVLSGDEAVLASPGDVKLETRNTRWGYPIAWTIVTGGQRLGPDSAERLRNAWRIGLCAEAGGLMEAATLKAVAHAAQRVQFGKPIGSLQAIQHRLARSFALSKGVQWFARRAASDPSDSMMAAAAACYASEGMRDVISATHQVCGGMGITNEFELLSYTARMAMLQTDLGGAVAHARAVAHYRWDGQMEKLRKQILVPPETYRAQLSAKRELADAATTGGGGS